MSKAARVVFSGIQPTGVPHVGNYLGALKNWVHIQNTAAQEDKIFFSIVGLHAITLPQNPALLRKERKDMLATLLAVGVEPSRCTLFHQDEVPEHAELAWILNCITPVGRLNRMTTWKSRLATARNANSTDEVSESMLQLGLLAYPVLQAADVLLYNTTEVPVGEDQEQHIELTRDIGESFNKQFSTNVFTIPRHVFTPQARVASLRNPNAKMSKSHPDPKSRIMLTDSVDHIASKIRSAVTDSIQDVSIDYAQRPGVHNLMSLIAGLEDVPVATVAARYQGKNAAVLKSDLTDVLIAHLGPIKKRLEALQADEAYLEKVRIEGREQAQKVASRTLAKVKRTIGLA